MKRTTVKVIMAPDGKRKVELFQRANGTYGFLEWVFGEPPYTSRWFPSSGSTECFVPDARTAMAEARGRVEWLRSEL